MVTSVGERGQITIPKGIRERLNVHPRDLAVQHVEGNHLVVTFLPAPHRRSLRGILKPRPAEPIGDWRDVEDWIAEDIAREAMGGE